MTQIQNFSVKPKGLVKGGTASYEANLNTGVIKYDAAVKVGLTSWMSHTYTFSGQYCVSPEILLSSSAKGVGMELFIGNVSFKVLSTTPQTALVSMEIAGQPMRGTALLDISGQYLRVIQMDAVVTVIGKDLELHLEQGMQLGRQSLKAKLWSFLLGKD